VFYFPPGIFGVYKPFLRRKLPPLYPHSPCVLTPLRNVPARCKVKTAFKPRFWPKGQRASTWNGPALTGASPFSRSPLFPDPGLQPKVGTPLGLFPRGQKNGKMGPFLKPANRPSANCLGKTDHGWNLNSRIQLKAEMGLSPSASV